MSGTPLRLAPREGQLGQLMRSFNLSLRAQNRSLATRDQYLMSVGQMVDYFTDHGGPSDPRRVTREHVEMFLADFAEDHKPATVQQSLTSRNRYEAPGRLCS